MELLTLSPGSSCRAADDGSLHLSSELRSEVFRVSEDGARELLPRLAQTLSSREAVEDQQHPAVCRLFGRLRARGWLAVTVMDHGRASYTVLPLRAPDRREHIRAMPPKAGWSRFALMRADGEGIILESPLAWCQVRVHQPALLAAIGALAAPAWPAGPAGQHVGPARFVHDLYWAGLIVADRAAEETELRQRQWAPHELWFHYRSRVGGGSALEFFGGTWWALGKFDPVPARSTARSPRPSIGLHRPDLAELRKTDPPLTALMEHRVSTRTGDDARPVTVAQLGEFLYRCARNRRQWTKSGVEYLSRPYPAGGSFYETELYVVARKVSGLKPGLYHYDAGAHQLEPISGLGIRGRRLLATAARAASVTQPPQVLLSITARIGRVMWKYESMAYALVLKDVGVLYQAMYMVATAMDLGCCALGTGDASTLAAAAGFDPMEECCVGEFMLSSRPDSS